MCVHSWCATSHRTASSSSPRRPAPRRRDCSFGTPPAAAWPRARLLVRRPSGTRGEAAALRTIQQRQPPKDARAVRKGVLSNKSGERPARRQQQGSRLRRSTPCEGDRQPPRQSPPTRQCLVARGVVRPEAGRIAGALVIDLRAFRAWRGTGGRAGDPRRPGPSSRRQVRLRHTLERRPVQLPGGCVRHVVEDDDFLRRLVADSLAGEPDELLAARAQVGGGPRRWNPRAEPCGRC